MMIPRSAAGAAGVIAAAAVLCYANTFDAPFILDDNAAILDNPSIRRLWPIHAVLTAAQEPGATTQGRPLLALTLAVNYAIGGESPASYHAVNLLIHILAALVLFGLVRRTLLLPDMAAWLRDAATPAAMWSALLWAVHPLATAAVTYVAQRAESLMALAYLLTVYCFARGAIAQEASAATGRPPPWGGTAWFVAAVAAATAGAATKEVIASVPLVVLAYDRLVLAASWRSLVARRWPVYLGLAASIGLLVALMLSSGSRGGTVAAVGGVTPLTYGLTQLGVILHYVRLSLWPSPLSFDYYGMPLAAGWRQILPGLIAVGAMLAATAALCWRRNPWAFAGVWFLLILAPTSSIVPMNDLAFEHRMYLPLAAVTTSVVVGGFALARHLPSPAARLWPVVLAALTVALGVATHRRNEQYRSPVGMWRSVIALRPANQRAHHNLAHLLAEAGDAAGALDEYGAAVALLPDDPTVYRDRGALYYALGRYDEALADYTRVIALRPESAMAFHNRGSALHRLRRYEEALTDLTRAVELEPARAEPYASRAMTLHALGRHDEAWRDVRQCRALGYEVPPAFLAALAAASGRRE